MSGLLFVLLIVTIIAEIAMPVLMYGLAPGFDLIPQKFDLAVLLTRITMPYLACMSIVALMSGVLNSVGRFAESASVSIVLNGVMMIATLMSLWLGYRAEAQAGVIQALAVFAAGFLQLALLMWGMWRAGLTLGIKRPRMTGDVRRLISLGIPGVVSGGVTQLNIAIGTIIASLQPGAVSQLYYANRVYELPLAIVGIAVGIVLLPDVTRQLRAGNAAGIIDSQNRSLEFALLLTVPAALALATIPDDITRVLFERGAFTPEDTHVTASVLGTIRARATGVRHDQGLLPRILCARGYEDADALCRHQHGGQHARLGSAVLPFAPHWRHAPARYRDRDDARRLAQCLSFVVDAHLAGRSSSPTRA